VLIELRDLEKAHTVDQLIAQHFARTPLRQISLDAFRYMLHHGRIVLLFDGFDELVLRSSYARAADHFETILQAVGGDAKIVVTSRTQFFRTDADVHAALWKTAIGQRVDQVFGRRLCDLLPFDSMQMFAYLSRRFQSDDAATKFFERLGEPLAELASNPRMLSFLADIPPDELLAALQTDPPQLADIYRVLLDRWLSAEHDRAKPRGAIESLELGERWDAVRALALRIWRSGDPWIAESDLGAIAAELVDAPLARQLAPEETAFQIGSGTLLVRDEAGRFSFIHPSVTEWLVAYDASQSIAAQQPPHVLAVRELSSLMVLFLVQMIGQDQAVAWASEALANAKPNEIAKTNALLILQTLGTSRAAGANLVRQNLSGHDLSGQSLIDADLTAATLDRATLVRTDLSGARLLRTSASVADFTDAVLKNADVRNATFTGSRMCGADLRVEHAEGASFRRCKLVGSKNGKLSAADTAGAVFDLPDSLETVVSTDCGLRALALACEGELLVGVGECIVRIWDLVAGVEVRRLRGHEDWVRDLSVHPNGRLCATCGDDAVVRIWDLGTGVEICTLRGSVAFLFSVAFHPGGELVAAGGKDGMIHVWQVDGGAPLYAIQAHENAVQSIAFSSDGAYLASSSEDRTVACWDTSSMRLVRRTTPFPTTVLSAVMRPGTTTIAFGTEAGEIWCWNALAADPVLLGAHEAKVTCLAFDADGQRLASASKDKTARVWDMNAADVANVELRRLKHDRGLIAVAFSPKSGELVTALDGGAVPLHFWDLSRAYEVRTFQDADGFDPEFAVTRDGMMAITGVDDKTTTLWDLHSAREIRRFQEMHLTLTATFSRDGGFVITGGLGPPTFHHLAPGGEDRTMYVFDRTLWTLALSPDGTQVACPMNHDIEVRGVERGELIARLKGHTATIWHLAFSPDGQRLVSGSSDHTTRLWDLRKQHGVVLPSSNTAPIRRVAFSPDGLLVGASGHRLRLWDTETGTVHESPLNGKFGRSLAFSDDGTRVALGDFGGRIHLYDLATGEETQRLERHDGTVKQLAFFGRDQMILSSAEDYTVRLWHLASESLMGAFASFPEGWVAYEARGRYKLGGSPSGRIWHAVNCCRFEAGELLPFRPDLQVAEDAPLYEFPAGTFDR
jgi:WD40 repeat protein